MTTLNNILDFTGGDIFYRFGNADDKYWVVPANGMHTAMHLYQPSGIKGKLVKALLPCLHWIAPVRKAIKAKKINCRLSDELRSLLCKVFGVQEIEFAIFEGTPSVHQKITMQLSRGKRILGYCKLSDSNDIKSLFEKESRVLDELCRKGVTNIPKALYCGTLSNGTHIFVQSTEKRASSKVIHEWGAMQEEFLSLLHEKTKSSLPLANIFHGVKSQWQAHNSISFPQNLFFIAVIAVLTVLLSISCGNQSRCCPSKSMVL